MMNIHSTTKKRCLRMAFSRSITVLFCAVLCSQHVLAETLSKDDIIQKLKEDRAAAGTSTGDANNMGATRSMGASRSTGASRGLSVQKADTGASSAGVNLRLQFEYNSADLTADSRTALDALAGAISSTDFATARFGIVGHTDASGDDSFNKNLSERRAQSVASYLRQAHGIGAERLSVWGEGEGKLYDAQNPSSAQNRRVQVYEIR